MRVRCSCGKDIKVPDHLAGKKLRCPACSKVLLTQAQEADPVEEGAAGEGAGDMQ